jgi:hypothetical protein
MANRVYNNAARAFGAGEIDWDADSVYILLCGTGSTCGDASDADVATVSAFTTLEEYVGTNYLATARKEVTAKVVTNTTGAGGKARLDSTADITYSSLGADAGGNCIGLVVYTGTASSAQDATNVPICFIDQPSGAGGFPFNGNGGDIVIQWGSDGILTIDTDTTP